MLHETRSLLMILKVLHNLWQAYKLYLKSKQHARLNRAIELGEDELNIFQSCISQFDLNDDHNFLKTIRMDVNNFKGLLLLLKKRLTRTSMRRPVSPEIRLALTIMYLVHGCNFQLLAWSFKLGLSTVRVVVYDTCQAIWDELQPVYLSSPDVADWEYISDQYLKKIGIPHCLGAIDGKLINISYPRRNDLTHYNFKQRFSIVLLASCDVDYKFTVVDVGAIDSHNENRIFTRSVFGRRILTDTLPAPEPKVLPNTNTILPYYFVGSSTFPLRNNLMRPFPGKCLPSDKVKYNKILSEARARIETAFAILANRWKVLRTTINAAPKNVDKIVLATVVLHNFLILQKDAKYFSEDDMKEIQSSSGKNLLSAKLSYSNRSAKVAFELRNNLKDYLNSQ